MIEHNKVDAFPAKAFFVKMLTRDISLEDAIMDLIDNCVDGIIRTKWATGIPEEMEKPYEGFHASITIDGNKFSIEDNCGGIPMDIALEYAFKMGRKNQRDSDIPTVGVYGIGMKRALFKMGKQSTVYSKTDKDSFVVEINSEWLDDDETWSLPLETVTARKNENGTLIEVVDLYDNISESYASITFINKLITLIQHHYSFIIQKGFSIKVNNTVVEPVVMKLLVNDNLEGEVIAPYIYKADIDGVNVLLEVGFYRNLPNEDEIDDEQVSRRTKEGAGWTIICNDRVVVYKDKTILTGWGEANVPSYHNQFIGISGIVIFKSNDSGKLPITTTKRGIDASSQLYLTVKNRMREGMKLFTDYTNKWKRDPEKEKEHSQTTTQKSIQELTVQIPQERWTKLTNTNPKVKMEERFLPRLPKPSDTNPRRFIRFARPESEIRVLSEFLLDSPDASPSEVGEKCFDKMLEEAKK